MKGNVGLQGIAMANGAQASLPVAVANGGKPVGWGWSRNLETGLRGVVRFAGRVDRAFISMPSWCEGAEFPGTLRPAGPYLHTPGVLID